MQRLGWIAVLSLLWACQSSAEAEYDGLRGARFGDALGSLMYRYYVPPDASPDHRLPLVLYLHDEGREGVDNEKQVDYRVTHWVENQAEHPCFVIAPQLPRGAWAPADITKGNYGFAEAGQTTPMQLVIELIELFLRRYSIDVTRIYVIGSSLGGFGTWELMMRRPHWIAAGVPIDGAGDPEQVVRIANIPIWVFHGAKDHTVPVAAPRAMIAALKAIGASPKYTEYPGVDHDSARRAFARSSGLDTWLFEQHK